VYAGLYSAPDICVVGGLTQMMKIAAVADARYVPVTPHNPMGPLATAANVHFAAATTNFGLLEYKPDDGVSPSTRTPSRRPTGCPGPAEARTGRPRGCSKPGHGRHNGRRFDRYIRPDERITIIVHKGLLNHSEQCCVERGVTIPFLRSNHAD
jgi:hypothetical protein